LASENHRLQYIRESLLAYREGKTTLGQLVDEVRLTIEGLAEGSLREELAASWGTLEDVYAIALFREELDGLPQNSVEAIEQAITELLNLIAHR
jgi:hypothetical protein